jgi:RNA polymerase sigma factor (sigma-70 family)
MIDSQASDEYIINCVKDGNIEKVAILFDRHHQNIYSYFYRLTRSKVVSEDLTQNVFVRLISYCSSYKIGHQFLPWVFRIAHNAFIDYHKYKTKELNCLNYYRDTLNSYDEIEVERNTNQLEIFYEAFGKLPSEYQELLLMNRYHDLTYKQIGVVLGLTERAVKQKTFRAINKLRKEYEILERVEL